jgi:hypothetical protein
VIADFFAMLDAPIRGLRFAAGTPAAHTLPDRRRTRVLPHRRSWSVRLEPGGFHTDHVHPQGWLSSAYYVGCRRRRARIARGLAEVRRTRGSRRTCTDHFVEPEAGLLALFPSFFWHGTVPFNEGGVRLTAAFDVLPV